MADINLILLVCAGLTVISVFTSIVAFRVGAPLLLIFLAIGLLAGENGPGGIVFNDAPSAYLVGSGALAVILFDSGFHTSLKSYRNAAAPAIVLATWGVALTSLIMAAAGHYLLHLSWPDALLIGTILASTDAAALFFLLRTGGITIRDRVRSTLEVESGTNDPVAIFLVLTIVALMTGDVSGGWIAIAERLVLQMGGGVLFGLLGGAIIIFIINRLPLEAGLRPVVVIAFAIVIFAFVNVLDGSGFLAAYLAGLVAGNARLQSVGGLRRFQDGITWLAQIVMFVTLGLLATPALFPATILPSVVEAAVLTFLARPVAVFLCLALFRFSLRERAFIAWVGLRGAVSILLALVPLLGAVPGAQSFFDIAFMVVIASLIVQGWTVRPLARWLQLIVPSAATPHDRMEMDIPGLSEHEMVAYAIHAGSAVARGHPLPRWARPMLLRRDGQVLTGPRELIAGDRVYLLATPAQLPLLDRVFGEVGDEAEAEAALYGDFVIAPQATVKALRETYDLPPAAVDDGATLDELFTAKFQNDLEPGDRLHLGPVDLIVREMREGRIHSLGVALEPVAQPGLRQRMRAKLAALLHG